jgi:hypothetical protein
MTEFITISAAAGGTSALALVYWYGMTVGRKKSNGDGITAEVCHARHGEINRALDDMRREITGLRQDFTTGLSELNVTNERRASHLHEKFNELNVVTNRLQVVVGLLEKKWRHDEER